MLDIIGLKKSFDNKIIVDDFNLHIDKGEVVTIIGPSGAGKTTALRCINFLEHADEGTMIFENQKYNMKTINKKEVMNIHKKTQFVFQNFNLFLNMTSIQNVSSGLIIGQHVPKEIAYEKSKRLLDKVGLLDKCDSFVTSLSGGQQQRVAIARALATDPKIIYFDEPTSALDPELTGEVLSVIKNLASEGLTMLIVTHEMNFASSVSDRVIFMEDGKIVEQGKAKELFLNPKEIRTKEFINSIVKR